MALGFSNTSSNGEIVARVQYDARAGRLFKVEREQDAGGAWSSDKIDITSQNPTFIVDMGSIEIGWLAFTATGPSFALAPLGSPFPERPTPEHKQGFRVKLFSPKNLDGLRELASSAKVVMAALDDLHSSFEIAPEAAQGKVPVVQLTGATPVVSKGKGGTSTNYAPIFKIVSWADRPADLGERTVPVPGARAAAPVSAPAPTNHVEAPKAREPAFADDAMPEF